MRSFRYVHLDVFADRPLSGNQLAVFTDADGLDEREMQLIAREMAFSETTFVLAGATARGEVRVRIFTPLRELPMAGHPTIGTTFALARERRIAVGQDAVTFVLGVGPTPVALEWTDDALAFAWMIPPAPTFEPVSVGATHVAEALGISASDVGPGGLPVEVASSGVPFLFVPVASREAADRVVLERGALRDLCESAGLPELPVFVFSIGRAEDDATTYSRMLAPVFGIPEDPATGGAGGPLGGYLVRHGVIPDGAARFVNLQGKAMGRPSRIHIALTARESRAVDLRVGGTSVIVGSGSLSL